MINRRIPKPPKISSNELEYPSLRQPILLHQSLEILKLQNGEELRILQSRYLGFQDELYSALNSMSQDYEEVVENEHGYWTTRIKRKKR